MKKALAIAGGFVLLIALSVPIVMYMQMGLKVAEIKKQIEQNKRAERRLQDSIDLCISSTRSRVRDHVRISKDIRLGGSTWHGDARVIVVSGFARTAKDDVPVNAEFSRCASGYTLAAITIGATTSVGDEIEYERVKKIMSETIASKTAGSAP